MKLTHAREKKSSGAKKSGKVGNNEEKRMIINNGSPRPDFPPTDTRSMDAVVNLNERFSRPEKKHSDFRIEMKRYAIMAQAR